MKKILQSQILWIAIFALVVAGAGYFGYQKWDQQRHVPPVVSHVTMLDQTNFKATVESGKPVYIEICTPDVCDMEKDALEAVATKLGDHITFAVVDAKAQAGMAMGLLKVLAQANGGKPLPIAFPMHIMISADGQPVGVRLGLFGPDDIAQFALGSLMAQTAPQPDANATAVPAPDANTTVTPNPNAAPNNGATVAPAPAAKQ